MLRVPAPRCCRARGMRWHQSHPRTCAEVLARVRAEGPLTATQLGGAKGGGPWWDWSETKIAVEWLLDIGEVVCVRRDRLAPGLRPARAGAVPASCWTPSRPTRSA